MMQFKSEIPVWITHIFQPRSLRFCSFHWPWCSFITDAKTFLYNYSQYRYHTARNAYSYAVNLRTDSYLVPYDKQSLTAMRRSNIL